MAGVYLHSVSHSLRKLLTNEYQTAGVIAAQCYVPPEKISRWCVNMRVDPSNADRRYGAKLRSIRSFLKVMGDGGSCDMRTNEHGVLEFKTNARNKELIAAGCSDEPSSGLKRKGRLAKA